MNLFKKAAALLLVCILTVSLVPAANAYTNLGGGKAVAQDLEDLEEALSNRKIGTVRVEVPITITHDFTIPFLKTVEFHNTVVIPEGVTLQLSNQAFVSLRGTCQLDGNIKSDNGVIALTRAALTGSGSITGTGIFNQVDGSTFSKNGKPAASGDLKFCTISEDISVDKRLMQRKSLNISNYHFNAVEDFSPYYDIVVVPASEEEGRTLEISREVELDSIHFNTVMTDDGIAWITLNICDGGSLTVKQVLNTEGLKVNVLSGGCMRIGEKGRLNGENSSYNVASELNVEEGGRLIVDGVLTVEASETEGESDAKLIVRGDLSGEGTVVSEGETRVCGSCSVLVDGNYWAPFLDTKVGAWYHDGVVYGVEHGSFQGVGNGLFDIDGEMSRAQLVTVLYRMEGEPSVEGYENPFQDVKPGRYYADAVKWALHQGIVSGVTADQFEPDAPVERQQVAAILYRYASMQGRDVSARADLDQFSDAKKVSGFARDAMQWAVAEGLITGEIRNEKFILRPLGEASRAQLATILYRYAENG